MSEFKEKTKEINKWVDGIVGLTDIGVDILFSMVEEEDVLQAEKELKTCKTICRTVKIIVLMICLAIIYFHVKG